jgi:hypothetical protein
MGIEVLEEMKEIGSNLILEFFERFFVSIYILGFERFCRWPSKLIYWVWVM